MLKFVVLVMFVLVCAVSVTGCAGSDDGQAEVKTITVSLGAEPSSPDEVGSIDPADLPQPQHSKLCEGEYVVFRLASVPAGEDIPPEASRGVLKIVDAQQDIYTVVMLGENGERTEAMVLFESLGPETADLPPLEKDEEAFWAYIIVLDKGESTSAREGAIILSPVPPEILEKDKAATHQA